MDRYEHNKKSAMDFYSLAFNENNPAEAVERYVGDEYIQHNPLVADGKQAFIDYFNLMNEEYPVKTVHFISAIAEDNLVVLHCKQEWKGDHEYAGMDIFRFDEDGKIVEHWDVLQIIPEASENDNTMF